MKVVSTAKLKEELRQDLVTSFPDIDFLFYPAIADAEKTLPEADIFLTYGEDLKEEHLETMSKLKWIMVISAGLEKMPLQKIKEMGVFVTNARGIHRIPMAEYTFTTLLSVAKQTKVWFEHQKQSKWDRSVRMEELFRETITVIGPGAIGSEIARLAKAFGMKTIGVNRSGQSVEFIDDVYKMSDLNKACATSKYVISILPDTKETKGLLDSAFFCALRPDAVFVNIGRGKTVIQADLLKALQNDELGHAILDVFEEEPLPEDHPFWKMDNVTITPHFSSVTARYQPRALEIFKENMRIFLENGENYINLIDLDRGY
ncbi:D-2-hydroxyacid dehydrogenase [Pullulanibacillus sp. KACC 23026]|uniref:D-2-hydroxyacid dehydrogenase n=1 Tax=Pullulanibacillus sp. KACC 23026 TaxID=3028315 RepID=UPI0023B030CA|nr:D-2-hydroxyacid dehydrogenase [Pullulanibacillus sp. KACC 23026]WEG12264.1 D-2-hydroxyacid dehydrogenase [Pullulanibacillus sp. KACC 23026]